MNEQPEALRLAEQLEHCINNAEDGTLSYLMYWSAKDAAAELRRLHEVNQELVEALEEIHEEPFDGNDVCRIARVALAKAKGESDD